MEEEWDNKVTIVTRDGYRIPAVAILGRSDPNRWTVLLTVDGHVTLISEGDVLTLTTRSGRASVSEVHLITGMLNNSTGEYRTQIHATAVPFPWPEL